jgi:hypothetical protein
VLTKSYLRRDLGRHELCNAAVQTGFGQQKRIVSSGNPGTQPWRTLFHVGSVPGGIARPSERRCRGKSHFKLSQNLIFFQKVVVFLQPSSSSQNGKPDSLLPIHPSFLIPFERLSLSTFLTPPPSTKRNSTSSNALSNPPTLISWTSNVQVPLYQCLLIKYSIHAFLNRMLCHHNGFLSCSNCRPLRLMCKRIVPTNRW